MANGSGIGRGSDMAGFEKKIDKVTGILYFCQKLEPNGENYDRCELEEGDDVFCDYELSYGNHPLHYAASDGNIEAIRSWVASGADVNVIDNAERTPLMDACMNLKEECVTELLKLGANVNAIDKYGETSLHKITNIFDFEKMEKMEKIAKTLIKAGCDPTKRNNNNETFGDILKRCDNEKLATKLEEWIKEATK